MTQIVHLNQSNSGGVAYTAYNGGVVARLQVCNNCRLACCSWNVATVLNRVNLISGDNPAEYRRLPVIIASNQCSAFVVQFQRRISQRIGDPKMRELRANGTNDHSLWPSVVNNETAIHHVLARLNNSAAPIVG